MFMKPFIKDAVVVDGATVLDSPTPPALTPTHFPVPHGAVWDSVCTALDRLGFERRTTRHEMTADRSRWFASIQLKSERSDWAPSLVVRNSHDRAFAAGLAVGSYTFVCDNLMFSGEIKLARKHTRWIAKDIGSLAYRAVAQLPAFIGRIEAREETYNRMPLTDGDAINCIDTAVEAKALPGSKALDVFRFWKRPEFAEHRNLAYNALRLQQAFTSQWRDTATGDSQILRGQRLVPILDSVAGFSN